MTLTPDPPGVPDRNPEPWRDADERVLRLPEAFGDPSADADDPLRDYISRLLDMAKAIMEETAVTPRTGPEPEVPPEPEEGLDFSTGPSSPGPPIHKEQPLAYGPDLQPAPAAKPFFAHDGRSAKTYQYGHVGTGIRHNSTQEDLRWCVRSEEEVPEEVCRECQYWVEGLDGAGRCQYEGPEIGEENGRGPSDWGEEDVGGA